MEKIGLKYSPAKRTIEKDSFEKQFWSANQFVCGIDEVGRGCFGGPVVAGAVILPIGCRSRLLVDSKTLLEADLLKSYAWIVRKSWYAVAWSSSEAVDSVNIYEATKIAMRRALIQVALSAGKIPSCVLVDAVPLDITGIFSTQPGLIHAPKGESWSCSIAAASIVAKVTRDRIVSRLDAVIPGFEFSRHKGYGTATHQKHILELGPSLVHRTTFIKNLFEKKGVESNEQQQTICGGY
jgi:ribonuclease HII